MNVLLPYDAFAANCFYNAETKPFVLAGENLILCERDSICICASVIVSVSVQCGSICICASVIIFVSVQV